MKEYAIFRRSCDHCGSLDWEQLSIWFDTVAAARDYQQSAKKTYNGRLFIFSKDKE